METLLFPSQKNLDVINPTYGKILIIYRLLHPKIFCFC